MDYSELLTDSLLILYIALAVVALAVLAVHYGIVYCKTGRYISRASAESTDAEADLPSLSVVLVSHNAADWLRENLVYLLEQDYPKPYEVVVVDYTSTDDTQFVLQLCGENYRHLKVVSLPHDVNMFKGKKFPLSMGIKSAKYDVLVLTDPDCVPNGFGWLRKIAAGYARKKTDMVLGCCRVKPDKGALNLLQRYDSMAYTSDYVARALAGHAETGCGKNLSYRKKFFYQQGAFTKMYTEMYGDDDLFVNQNAGAASVSVSVHPDSWMLTESYKTMDDWLLHRRIRTATRKWHSGRERLRRFLVGLSVAGFYAAVVLMLVRNIWTWPIAAGLFVLKTAWQIFAVSRSAKGLEQKNLQWHAPWMEIYFLILDTIFAIFPLSQKSNRWK